jgi:hypothetical protein
VSNLRASEILILLALVVLPVVVGVFVVLGIVLARQATRGGSSGPDTPPGRWRDGSGGDGTSER